MRTLANVVTAMAVVGSGFETLADPIRIAVNIDSGWLTSTEDARTTIFSRVVRAPGAGWVRIDLGETTLGAPPQGGRPTVVRFTSILDAAQQPLEQVHLDQWQYSSAYFNGEAVLVEVIADPGAQPSRIRIDGILAGPGVDLDSICGPTDDRQLSNDPRVGRGWTSGGSANCTVWLIDDCGKCLLAAGHCGPAQAHFNIPLSTNSGTPVQPPPEDQYAIDMSSMQSQNGGLGNDWMYFGVFRNPITGQLPFERQRTRGFELSLPPAPAGDEIRITGCGITSSPVHPSWNRAQKTHVGPYVQFTGTTVRYATDTTSGNSGSPVIHERTGRAIGIHTHGGCTSTGGSNAGTGLNNAGLQAALTNPRGVCAISACYADCDRSTGPCVLDIFDFLCFQNRFAAADPYACDCDTSTGRGVCDIFDFVCFGNAFAAGC